MTDRTTDTRGATGAACSSCSTPFDRCTEGLATKGACCARCAYTDTHEAEHPDRASYIRRLALETNADWRGTPLVAGGLAVWVVGNHTAVEGEVVSWTTDTVTVRPLRRSSQPVGQIPRADDHPGPREMTIDRAKVTMLRPPGPGVVAG